MHTTHSDRSNVQGGGANALPQNFISMYKFYCRKKLILVSSLNAPPQTLQISPHVFLPLQSSFSGSFPGCPHLESLDLQGCAGLDLEGALGEICSNQIKDLWLDLMEQIV